MNNPKKIFTTSQQLQAALFRVSSLNESQRAAVFEALRPELDDNGVSAEELKRVLRELRLDGKISDIDRRNLLQLAGEEHV
ncbi:MAG: hypothetical protein A2951_00475 [Candidatus Buchananbacteria bacterium RIFCSPLOWO2_01_FULL_56_15]|uniref:Uncharacterized protein n=2 Tax=Candidatus Buchananiibacteriota TaxID=1817903 RepID=A0A1G1YJI1_9BACT|nr:MAG: hypothetical protein A3J59_01955 [Candidatus Buchananbacteria bacterium RIFCSPHIGHO2_02_FULL_56_16]OGY54906.1 MAG: hypothetical protein A2951_00475 [Candidatus Buchananbacteria bacterium RIFCSPLOWO2_01_FULL_56_15]